MGVDVPLHLFFTLAQVVNINSLSLYPPERTLVPIEKETGWVLEPFRTFGGGINSFPLLGLEPQIVQAVVQSKSRLLYKTGNTESLHFLNLFYVKCKYVFMFRPSIHVWRYSSFWALASPRKTPSFSLTLTSLLQPRLPRIYNIFLWTTSCHLVLGFSAEILL